MEELNKNIKNIDIRLLCNQIDIFKMEYKLTEFNPDEIMYLYVKLLNLHEYLKSITDICLVSEDNI